MAAEKAQIIEVKNNLIRVALPDTAGNPETYLTTSYPAGYGTISVKDNARFTQNSYAQIGQIGEQQSEIKRITGAVTVGSSLTVASTTFAHPVNCKITLVYYDQVEIYGSTTATDTAPTLIGSAVALDVRRGYTEIKATTTYAYYYARYKDSNAGTYSLYSDAVASTGLSNSARGKIKKRFLLFYNERLDDIVTDEWLNECVNDWQGDLIKRRRQWTCLRAQDLIATVQDQQKYALSTDMVDRTNKASIMSVKFYNHSALSNADQGVFQNLTYDHIGTTVATTAAIGAVTLDLSNALDFPSSGTCYSKGQTIVYTGKSGNTLTGVSGITAGCTAGDEVWSTYTHGQPNTYNINNGYIALYPIPNATYASHNLIIDYWKDFPDLTDDTSETLFQYPDNCIKYLFYKLAIRRRLPLLEQKNRENDWKDEVEELVNSEESERDVFIQPVDIYYNPY